MNKIKVRKMYINLQQGLLVMDNDFVVGGFCHHKKSLVLRAPGYPEQFEIPKELETYDFNQVHHLEVYAFFDTQEILPI